MLSQIHFLDVNWLKICEMTIVHTASMKSFPTIPKLQQGASWFGVGYIMLTNKQTKKNEHISQ
jgi:hypothetical protein